MSAPSYWLPVIAPNLAACHTPVEALAYLGTVRDAALPLLGCDPEIEALMRSLHRQAGVVFAAAGTQSGDASTGQGGAARR